MAHALRLAARGLGETWPNPSVGCVIVRGGIIVGRGRTAAGGRPHAERVALDQAGARARGATVYTTLEPCSHRGKTRPCADALVHAGVARVVSALTDPDPRVAGRGHARLRGGGIEVHEGLMAEEARRLNAGFLKRVTRGLPFLTLKLATTLDGRIATMTGESRWITGADARRRVHLMRTHHDAVLVGAGTARADDPDLRARDLGPVHQPVRIVIDGRLTHAPESRLGRGAHLSPVWIVHGPDAPQKARAAWEAAGARLFPCPTDAQGHVAPREALRALAQAGITRILCEGGATLAAALVRAELVDRLVMFQAGTLIGAEGVAAVGAMGLARLADAPRFRLATLEHVGGDTLAIWDAADAS